MKIYDFQVNDINKKPVKMSKYNNKVLLIVNVASKCGHTKQYSELEALYEKYKEKGFCVLGFPCSQFLFQEFNDNEKIKAFCSSKYNVTFDLFDRINVRGSKIAPLYEYLINEFPITPRKKAIRWNFEKFLIDKSGKIVNRFAPEKTPKSFEKEILSLL